MKAIDQRIVETYFQIAFMQGMQYGRDNPAEPLSMDAEDDAAMAGALAEQKSIDHPKENSGN